VVPNEHPVQGRAAQRWQWAPTGRAAREWIGGVLVWLAIAALSRLTDDRLALVVLPASLGVLVYLAGFWEDLRRLRQS